MWPHTWQVCGIGRGNHSVHLEWALCFHLGQWCRRGNFQPKPDSLSARWKMLTSCKIKTAVRPMYLKVLVCGAWWFDSVILKSFSKLCKTGFFLKRDRKCYSNRLNIWALESKILCPITRSDNPIIHHLYRVARGKLHFLISAFERNQPNAAPCCGQPSIYFLWHKQLKHPSKSTDNSERLRVIMAW